MFYVAFLYFFYNNEFRIIVDRTKSFFSGFYSPFGLELLSTIDFIMDTKNVKTQDEIFNELERWSDRKKTKFNNPNFIQIATDNIYKHGLVKSEKNLN